MDEFFKLKKLITTTRFLQRFPPIHLPRATSQLVRKSRSITLLASHPRNESSTSQIRQDRATTQPVRGHRQYYLEPAVTCQPSSRGERFQHRATPKIH